MDDKVFDKFRSRLVKEGWLKAALCGLTVGFAALLITAFICWFIDFKAVWICAIVFAAVIAIAIPVFYFALFRPDDKKMARRLDKLGLEERIITMKELEGNDSFMASRQRADAVSAIGKVNANSLKIAVSIPLIAAISITAVLGTGMTVVSALAAAGIVEPGKDIIDKDDEKPVETFTVTYDVDGDGGYIDGDIVQVIDKGADASAVYAVAEEGYAFIGWTATYIGADNNTYPIDDLEGYDNPARQDFEVTRNMTILAVFMEVDSDGEPGDDGDGDGEATDSDDKPADSDGSSDGSGNGSDSSGDPNGGGAGGEYSEKANQIIDGDTYYGGDTFDNAHSDAMDSVGKDDGDRGSIGDYFDIIQD